MKKKKKSKKSAAGLVRYSITDLIPNKPSFKALDVNRQRQEEYAHIALSYSAASNRLEAIEKRRPAAARAVQALDVMADMQAISQMHSDDAFEEMRRKLGLNEKREELEQRLVRMVSPKYGLELFNRSSIQFFRKEYHSITELNEDFPHLTFLEIAMLALLRHAPTMFLIEGTAFNPIAAYGINGPELEAGFLREMMQQVPMHFTSNVMSFVYSTHTVDTDPKVISGDSYHYLGFTGESEDEEFVTFRRTVKSLIDQLIPLEMSNNRLHESVWKSVKAGLQVGMGRVAAEAYRRTLSLSPDAKLGMSLTEAIEKLSPSDRVRFETEQKELENHIYGCEIVDLTRQRLLRKDELFVLIALLGSVPTCFLEGAPFSGYLAPYGVGVKFIGLKGQVVEYRTYSEWYVRQAILSFNDESADISTQNRTAAMLFDRLGREAEDRLFQEYYLAGEDLSAVEQVANDIWLRYGIKLEIVPRHQLIELTDWNIGAFHYGNIKDGFQLTSNLKFGLTEARSIEQVLGLLPRIFLSGFRSIAKFNLAGLTLAAHMTREQKEGEFLATTKSIALYESSNETYNSLPLFRQALHAFTLVHEIGESIWPTLTEKQQQLWKSISWSRKRVDLKKHFLTWYSHHVGPRDDFCEHFACYVFHGEEFRQQARRFQPLGRKYRFIRDLFAGRTGEPKEYPKILQWTPKQLHGELEKEVRRISLAQAQAEIEEKIRKAEQAALSHISEMVSSFEQLVEDELRDDEEQELD